MFAFRIIWHAFLFCNTRFEIRPFALLPTNLGHRQRGSLNHPVLLLTLTIFHTLLLTLNRYMFAGFILKYLHGKLNDIVYSNTK